MAQARHLVGRRPATQADLKRAVSAAYYALFHFLVGEACRSLLGDEPEGSGLRTRLSRAFDHGRMADAARAFFHDRAKSADVILKVGRETKAPGAALGISDDIKTVARTFVDLQENRHDADYDLSIRFERTEVMGLLKRVGSALELWPAVRDRPAARLYLLALLYGHDVVKAPGKVP